MPESKEGTVAPTTDEAKEALAELQKEGYEIADHQPIDDDGNVLDEIKPSPKEDETEETEEEKAAREEKEKGDANEAAGLSRDGSPKTESKVDRTPTLVEAWKLKTAEDQKQAALDKVKELEDQLKDLSTQKGPITETQKDDISETIKQIAEESGQEVDFLTKFADTILKTAESRLKPNADVEATLKKLKDKEQSDKEHTDFLTEFDKDVAPLLKDHELTDEALKDLKQALKDHAFSETYAKVPLKEVFQLKQAELIKEPKRSSEGKQMRVRTNAAVDFENMTEEQFANLTAEQVEQFTASKAGKSWEKK